MLQEPEAFNQIAFSLARHYECVYYVDIETGHYVAFTEDAEAADPELPREGNDFFGDCTRNAEKYIHPSDLANVLETYDRENMVNKLSCDGEYTIVYRSIAGGKVIYMRQVEIMCKDGKHIVCCLENVDAEMREKEEQLLNLRSAERMARRDKLTGVKNSNAFKEFTDQLDKKIASGSEDVKFGIIMCDINDLKLINDTIGHHFGDEAIQATSRLICKMFHHSPVFRVGGDEFIVVLRGNDYENRDYLLERLREESDSNRRTSSGPVVASGIAVFEEGDEKTADVVNRADQLMYENKSELKSRKTLERIRNMERTDTPIPEERKRLLDAKFGAMLTVAGGGYVFLNDMKYDYSRWAISLLHDFGLESEYMYHADKVWQEYIHPDDLEVYKDAVNDVLCGNAEVKPIKYRARKKDGSYALLYTRGFVLNDADGNPEYFGGIIIEDRD